MRFNDKYKIWELGNDSIIIEDAAESVNLSDVYRLNETSVFLWKSFGEKDFTHDDLIELICREYHVAKEIAREDVEAFVKQMKGFGFII